MRRSLLLPHTADIELKVNADSLEELFKGAVDGMSNLLHKQVVQQPSSSDVVAYFELTARDSTSLLIDFLNEILTRNIIDGVVLYDMKEFGLNGNHLAVRLQGLKVQGFDEDIKAVTYHGAEIEQDKQGKYHVKVVFDV